MELMSNEKQVTKDTPPTFIVHGADDKVVPIENALMFVAACAKADVPCTFVMFKHGQHGFGLGKDESASWPAQCAAWMEGIGMLKKEAPKK